MRWGNKTKSAETKQLDDGIGDTFVSDGARLAAAAQSGDRYQSIAEWYLEPLNVREGARVESIIRND
jgi:hypothetical protein